MKQLFVQLFCLQFFQVWFMTCHIHLLLYNKFSLFFVLSFLSLSFFPFSLTLLFLSFLSYPFLFSLSLFLSFLLLCSVHRHLFLIILIWPLYCSFFSSDSTFSLSVLLLVSFASFLHTKTVRNQNHLFSSFPLSREGNTNKNRTRKSNEKEEEQGGRKREREKERKREKREGGRERKKRGRQKKEKRMKDMETKRIMTDDHFTPSHSDSISFPSLTLLFLSLFYSWLLLRLIHHHPPLLSIFIIWITESMREGEMESKRRIRRNGMNCLSCSRQSYCFA